MDIKMGTVLLIGGVIGAVFGVQLVKLLRQAGQVDLIISLSYVTFLGIIGSLMLIESLRAIRRSRAGKPIPARRPGQHNWIHGLPFKMRFKRSKLYISAIPPLVIGAFVGLLAAIMGVGDENVVRINEVVGQRNPVVIDTCTEDARNRRGG